MHRDYYEAIIQLRPENRKAEGFIEAAIKSTGKARLVSKKVRQRGLDIYVSSWKYAVALGSELKKRFGGKTTISRKLYGGKRGQGKVVYRCTVLYRGPEIEVGEVLAVRGKVLRITSIGKRVFGKNLETGKKERVSLKGGWERLEKRTAQVAKTQPVLEVISPEDYQSAAVANQSDVKEDKVQVVVHKGRVYLVG